MSQERLGSIKSIRPEIKKAKVHQNMSFEETFQNQTIRPVIKLQAPLIYKVFKNYIKKKKNRYLELNTEKRIQYIENSISRDHNFRNLLKGIIIGQFTVSEFESYTSNPSGINKRIMSILKERLISNIQLFDANSIDKAS